MKKVLGFKDLNKQQLAAVRYNSHGGGPLLIIAGAGTGKTTVITERIKYLIEKRKILPSEILALTFTEKAAREMEERVDVAMPYGYTQMWISTFHSFCDRVLRAEALHVGLDPRYKLMTQAETIQFIRNNLFKFKLKYFRPLGNPTKFISGMLQHFSRLQDEDVTPLEYLRWAKKQKMPSSAKALEDKRLEVEKWIELSEAYRQYDQLKVNNSLLDYGDLIVKTLHLFRRRKNILNQYKKQFKHLLVDEFQDTNFAQNELAILLAGKGPKANITVTGDDDQCLPPNSKIKTPSGTKSIKSTKKGDQVITAVGKGHTSISTVNKVFKNKRKATFLTFVTESGKTLKVTNNHKLFGFIPGHYKTDKWSYVYLMKQSGLGWRLGITNNPPARLRLERGADYILIIGSYESEQEARYNEALFSVKYGIPTVPFSPRPKQAIAGKWLQKLFREIDTQNGAEKLAKDLGLELNSPQFLTGGVTRGKSRRVKINFTMCFRNYRSKTHKQGFVGSPHISHMVWIETSDRKTIDALIKHGYKLTKIKKGRRLRIQNIDIRVVWRTVEKLEKITGGIIDKKFNVGKYNYQHLPSRIVPAGNVFPGMYLPVLNKKKIVYEKVISRKQSVEILTTYDLEVDQTHNFIADGVVVHNSVYRFRGAAISNIVQFRKIYPKAKVITLTQNYRSTQEILDRSYDLIQHNNPDRLEAVEKIDKKLKSAKKDKGEEIIFIHTNRVENESEEVVKEIEKLTKGNFDYKDFAILVRANNHAEPFIRALQRHNVPYQFLGPGRLFKQPEIIDLVSYLKVLYNFEDSVSFYRVLAIDHFGISARELIKISNYAKRKNLSLFESCEQVEDVYISDEARKKIKKLVGIVKRHFKLVKRETAGQLLYYFLEDTNLITKLLNPDTVEAEKKAVNISKLFDKLKTYEVDHEDATVTAVVDFIDLATDLGESPLAADSDWTEVNAVNILTAHSAKGLEFPVVFLVNLVSQRFPTVRRREQIPIPDELIKEVLPQGDYHVQEERRLFYVGMTRAKERLYFAAANYYGEGKREKKLSPFIFEALGDEVVGSERCEVGGEQLTFLDYKPKAKPSEALAKEGQPLFRIDYLSYSQIATFKICPLHYKLRYIIKIPTLPSAALSFGTSIHKVMNDFYKSVATGSKPTPQLMYKLLEVNWINDGYKGKSHEKQMYDRGRVYLSGYLKEGFKETVKPVALEQSFVLPLEFSRRDPENAKRLLKIGGKIDRIDKVRGGIEIIDYKTGEKVPTQKDVDKDEQLTFYALAVSRIKQAPFGVAPKNIKLSLYYFETQEKITTSRTKEQLIEAERQIFKWRDEVESSDFKCSKNYLCRNCEYKLMCDN